MFLLDRKLIATKPSTILDNLYSTGKIQLTQDDTAASTTSTASTHSSPDPKTADGKHEAMLLDKTNAPTIAKALEIPELEVELARAVWQVENSMKAKEELKEEKQELDQAVKNHKAESQEQEKEQK